jgi:pyrophosphatase PpaX
MAMPAPARKRTVLFDLDGTLLDSIELILSSARFAFAKLERPAPSDEEWLTGVGIPLRTMFGRYARDDDERERFVQAYREYQIPNHDRLVRAYDGVVETILELRRRGHEIGVVTSKSESLALRGLACVGLARYMDTIVGCDSCTRHKPDPEPVRLALHRLACEPGDAVFVGDSVHDVIAGNAAGVTTMAALWGPFGMDDLAPGKPNHYVTTISEVIGLV